MAVDGSEPMVGANALDVPHPAMPSDAELVEALRVQLEAMLPPAREPGEARGAGEAADIAALLSAPEADESTAAVSVAESDLSVGPTRPTHDQATLSLLDELDRLWARGGA